MPALCGAFALPEMTSGALFVGDNLHFYVAGRIDESFNIDIGTAEGA